MTVPKGLLSVTLTNGGRGGAYLNGGAERSVTSAVLSVSSLVATFGH